MNKDIQAIIKKKEKRLKKWRKKHFDGLCTAKKVREKEAQLEKLKMVATAQVVTDDLEKNGPPPPVVQGSVEDAIEKAATPEEKSEVLKKAVESPAYRVTAGGKTFTVSATSEKKARTKAREVLELPRLPAGTKVEKVQPEASA